MMRFDLSLKINEDDHGEGDDDEGTEREDNEVEEVEVEEEVEEEEGEGGYEEKERLNSGNSMSDELSSLHNEMTRIKEENKSLRRAIEQTMKEHYDLQIKLSEAQHHSQLKEYCPTFLSLGSGSKRTHEGIELTKKPIPPTQHQESHAISKEDKELGLSLRLHEGGEAVDQLHKPVVLKTELFSTGMPSQSLPPPNRKARVSVRARCQGPTVSSSIKSNQSQSTNLGFP
ncbi:hypothetical protein QJS10_CPB12g01694 [Acorus calamus]|uniref:Uncharacterized protein n=1 Tax=Acorus calamus TaxID=4465 RepID=A0AAV9DMJ8_ACOCL|nr:hypothetical protein QJS10_CPB12g01694 [Acorus calamus]